MQPDIGTPLVTVASCQLSVQVGEPERNRAAAVAAVRQAADRGAQVVVLPELTPSGYVFAGATEARSLAEPPDGITSAQWASLAASRQIVIVGGLLAALALSIFVLPTLYVWFAGDGDKLPEPEPGFEESA